MAHPTTFTFLQYHGGDPYQTTLTGNRQAFYYTFNGYPTSYWDGVTECRGAYTNDPQMLAWYTSTYNSKIAVPTDLSIHLTADTSGDPNGAGPWHVSAKLLIDANGTGKTVRLWIVHALDNYPNTGYTDHRDRMCVRPPIPAPLYHDVALVPGVPQTVTVDFTFDSTSMGRTNDIRIVSWAQTVASTYPAQIFNAAVMSWPFPPSLLLGDLNCDGAVDFLDINPFVLAISDPGGYAIQYPDCNILAGDINGDGRVDFLDINPCVELLTPP